MLRLGVSQWDFLKSIPLQILELCLRERQNTYRKEGLIVNAQMLVNEWEKEQTGCKSRPIKTHKLEKQSTLVVTRPSFSAQKQGFRGLGNAPLLKKGSAVGVAIGKAAWKHVWEAEIQARNGLRPPSWRWCESCCWSQKRGNFGSRKRKGRNRPE